MRLGRRPRKDPDLVPEVSELARQPHRIVADATDAQVEVRANEGKSMAIRHLRFDW
jgi:hypothetical protein